MCVPYSIENLHKMADDLNIKRCWFHNSKKFPHYDIPKKRFEEISSRCILVSPREILKIIKGRQNANNSNRFRFMHILDSFPPT